MSVRKVIVLLLVLHVLSDHHGVDMVDCVR